MCRSIKVLRQPAFEPTDEDIQAAALQFVRKISGYRTPSRTHEQAFSLAVQQITASSKHLLESLKPVISKTAKQCAT